MRKYIINKYTLTIFGIILFLMLWWLLSYLFGHGSRVFPDPWSTFAQAFNYLGSSTTYLHIGYSLYRMISGFLLAAVLGLILGMIVGNFKQTKYVFNPTMVAIKAVPTAVFVYLFLVLVGAKNSPILVVFLITFPIIYEAVVGGYTNIDRSIMLALKVDGNSFFKNNFKVKLPLSMPYIIVGLASSFALSFKLEIMAEVISGSTSYGLGNIIRYCQQNDYSNLTPIFAYSLIAVILMLLVSLLLSVVKTKTKLNIKK